MSNLNMHEQRQIDDFLQFSNTKDHASAAFGKVTQRHFQYTKQILKEFKEWLNNEERARKEWRMEQSQSQSPSSTITAPTANDLQTFAFLKCQDSKKEEYIDVVYKFLMWWREQAKPANSNPFPGHQTNVTGE